MGLEELKKVKYKRRLYFICFVVLLILILCREFLKSKNYEIDYKRNEISIHEQYKKDLESYFYTFTVQDKEFTTAIAKKYIVSRKLVREIAVYEEDDEMCLDISSNQLSFEPLCRKNDEQLSFALVSDKMKEHFSKYHLTVPDDTSSYEAINVHSYMYHNYYLWNYRGFYHLNNQKQETISLFSNDIYTPKLIIATRDYLFVPDFTSEFYFSKAFVIDAATGKVITWKLKHEIYFDSEVLGVIGNNIYLLDKHEKKEWKINLKATKLDLVGSEKKDGVIFQDKWLTVNMAKLLNQNSFFSGLKNINFVNEDSLKAYVLDKAILMKKEPVKEIIFSKDDEVYYLLNDSLYMNSFLTGEVKLLTNFEWNFNYQDMIFIF